MARDRIVGGSTDSEAREPASSTHGEGIDLLDPHAAPEEDASFSALRPRSFEEYVGQGNVISSLKIAVRAARDRGDAVDHVLFHGPPGLGKTTLAHIIAREMDKKLTHTSGPTLERPLDMVGLLSNLEAGEILFIDEIHRIPRSVEEYLYSAMEDYKVDFVTGKGTYSRTLTYRLAHFTLVGATTRAGMLSAPLRDRFGMVYHLDYYSAEELTQVVNRSATILEVSIASEGAREIARRSRGTPRVANRLLRRVRDFAQVNADGRISHELARDALELEGVDELGLDRLDRLYLSTLGVQYKGGPAGIEAIAATVNEDAQTLADVVEPFLLKIGFIIRTPSGRRITEDALDHLDIPYADAKGWEQPKLL